MSVPTRPTRCCGSSSALLCGSAWRWASRAGHPDNNAQAITALLAEQGGRVTADVTPAWIAPPPFSVSARRDLPFYRLRIGDGDKATLLGMLQDHGIETLWSYVARSRETVNQLRQRAAPIPPFSLGRRTRPSRTPDGSGGVAGAKVDVWRYMEEATPWGTPTAPQNFSCFRCPALVSMGGSGAGLLAFAEARTWTGDGCVPADATPTPYRNFSIVMKASTHHGESWGPNTIVAVGGLNPAAVFDTRTQTTVLHFASDCASVTPGAKGMCTFQMLCTAAGGCRDKQLGGAATSADDCVLRGNCNGVSPGPGNGAQLVDGPHAGRLVFAGHLGMTDLVWYSDDDAATWKMSSAKFRAITNESLCYGNGGQTPCYDEPAVVQRPDGAVLISMRSDAGTRGHRRFQARSDDGAQTFGSVALSPVNLTEPPGGCQASFARGGHGNAVLYFCNPSWAGGRTQMSVRRSTDGGMSWPRCTEAQRMGPQAGCDGVVTIEVNGSSYSSLAPMGASRIGVLYERGMAYGDAGCAGVACRISFMTLPTQF